MSSEEKGVLHMKSYPALVIDKSASQLQSENQVDKDGVVVI